VKIKPSEIVENQQH